MSSQEDQAAARIEAALYAAGRPLAPEELARAAGITSKRKAVALARDIARRVNDALKAVEVAELMGTRFALQLKQEYTGLARRFSTRPLMSTSALKTLSYVAYLQPVSAQELSRRRGPQAYSHLKLLEEMGFVSGEPSGRTKIYKTTSTFSSYFGLSAELEALKQQLSKLGPRKPSYSKSG